MLRNFFQALAILVSLTGLAETAAAQSLPLGQGSARPEDVQREQREQNAYSRALEKVPDKEKKSKDPWGNVRSSPQASDSTRKPRQ